MNPTPHTRQIGFASPASNKTSCNFELWNARTSVFFVCILLHHWRIPPKLLTSKFRWNPHARRHTLTPVLIKELPLCIKASLHSSFGVIEFSPHRNEMKLQNREYIEYAFGTFCACISAFFCSCRWMFCAATSRWNPSRLPRVPVLHLQSPTWRQWKY